MQGHRPAEEDFDRPRTQIEHGFSLPENLARGVSVMGTYRKPVRHFVTYQTDFNFFSVTPINRTRRRQRDKPSRELLLAAVSSLRPPQTKVACFPLSRQSEILWWSKKRPGARATKLKAFSDVTSFHACLSTGPDIEHPMVDFHCLVARWTSPL